MYNVVLHFHSSLRWVILLLLLIAFFRSATAKGRPFTATDKKIGLILMICADVMLLIGLYQWFAGNWGLKSIQNNGMHEVMKNPTLRFYAIEHAIGMLIAIIMIHIGRSYAKKSIPDPMKHRRTVLFFGLALLIILVSLPWPFREAGAGRGWF
jgi:hypothetical protein